MEGRPYMYFLVEELELLRWTESCTVIGYLSWQDGAILPAQDTGFVPQEKCIYILVFYPI